MKNRIIYISVFFLIALCAVLFTYVAILNSNIFKDIDNNVHELSSKWVYSYTYNNNRTTIPVDSSDKEHIFSNIMAESVHLSSTISKTINISEKYIILYTVHSSVYVKVDNRLIYSYDNANTKRHIISSPGNGYHFIPIPSNYLNKEISIDLINSYPSVSMSFSNVFVSTKTDFLRLLISKYFISSAANILIVFLGLYLLMASIMLLFKKYLFSSTFWLSLFSIFTGTWLTSESRLIRVFIHTAELQYFICFLSLYLMPIVFLMYIATEFKPRRMSYVNGMLFSFEGFLILALTLQILKVKDLVELLPLFHFLLSTSFLIIFIIMITEYINTKKKRYKRFFFSSSFLLIFGLLEVINYYVKEIKNE